MARLDPQRSSISQGRSGISIELALSQPVPWRVRVLDHPARLLMDFRDVDLAPLGQVRRSAPDVIGLRAGQLRRGWSRLVLELGGPYLVSQSEMRTTDGTRLRITLRRASPEAFAEKAALPEPGQWSLPKLADVRLAEPADAGRLVVALDPGHGGIDPGAERDGISEAQLMLGFARELEEILLRDGRFRVVMTREEDEFVPLEARVAAAHQAGAQVFLSLHADALASGEAVGATLYTLSDEASDEVARRLAESHNRDDLLSGIDLKGQDEVVTTILLDLARTETAPRIERLALALESSIKAAGLTMHRHARQKGGFAVLKSADIPSVLIELGFLSSPGDLARLRDPAWRATMADAIRSGLLSWSAEDATRDGFHNR